MPPSRRSRRLSNQEPKNYAELEDRWHDAGPFSLSLESFQVGQRPLLSNIPTTPSALLFPTSFPDKPQYIRPSSSHTIRHKKSHITRPPNAFMLFRSIFWANEKLKEEPIERDHRDISRIAAHCWNTLDDAAKNPYRELALQKKLQHGLEHPDYKYKPAFPRGRFSKRKVRRSDDAEEERCRKLASLVMDGVSSAGIREAMKNSEKKSPLSICRASTTEPRVSKTSRAQCRAYRGGPSQLSSIESGSANTKEEFPLIQMHLSDDLNTQDNSFVPTEEIPLLELSPVKKEEETFTIQFDPSIQLPIRNDLDSHFGIKPVHSDAASNFCFWGTRDDMVLEDESDLGGVYLPEHTNQTNHSHGPVALANPYVDYRVESSHPGPMLRQGSFNVHLNQTTTTNDSDMNEYFRFD